MSELSSRERVLLALAHEEADRVPTALGGGPYGVVDELYFKLLDHLALGEPVAPFRSGHNISYMDDRLLDRLGTDLRYVWPGASPSSPTEPTGDPDTLRDNFGQTWKRAFPYYYADTGILNTATQTGAIDTIVNWPDTSLPRWTTGVRNRAQRLRDETDCFIVGRMVTSHGVFQTACDLRGTAAFMMDLALNEEFAQHLLERVTATIDGLLERYVQAAGDAIDMIELPGDDYASNQNLLISPQMFERFILPALDRLVSTIRAHNPALKIMVHSDGNITALLPYFVELGIDVVHPLEPVPSMDLGALKAQYGKQLTFLGSIDISHAMPGTQSDVIGEVKRRVAQLAPGGGYILAPCNHLQADVPPENVVTLYEAAREFGQYPIRTVAP